MKNFKPVLNIAVWCLVIVCIVIYRSSPSGFDSKADDETNVDNLLSSVKWTVKYWVSYYEFYFEMKKVTGNVNKASDCILKRTSKRGDICFNNINDSMNIRNVIVDMSQGGIEQYFVGFFQKARCVADIRPKENKICFDRYLEFKKDEMQVYMEFTSSILNIIRSNQKKNNNYNVQYENYIKSRLEWAAVSNDSIQDVLILLAYFRYIKDERKIGRK